jgi:hypothetical protein
VLVEDLSIDDPGGWVPGGCVECSPQVEEEHSSDTTTTKLGGMIVLRLRDRNVGSDCVHADTATDRSDHEHDSAASMVDKVDHPDDSDDGLDYTEDTGAEQTGRSADDTDGLENGRRIVLFHVNCIHGVLPGSGLR